MSENEPIHDPLTVAKGVLREVLRNLEYFSHCDFCRAGDCDDDGGDALHTDECPLYGFDRTVDVERLKAWAMALAEAQMDRRVAAKTGPGKPMRVAYVEGYDEGLVYGYANGISDGAAQERARIVAFVRKRHRGTGLADLIERGEAGE